MSIFSRITRSTEAETGTDAVASLSFERASAVVAVAAIRPATGWYSSTSSSLERVTPFMVFFRLIFVRKKGTHPVVYV